MKALNEMYAVLDEVYLLSSIHGILDWDQQVVMPKRAGDERGRQIEILEKLKHERLTSERFLGLVDELAANLGSLAEPDQVNVRETKRLVDRKRKLPTSFVAEKAKITSKTFNTWLEARPKNDFKLVQPMLTRLFDMAREEAKLVGYKDSAYDALLSEYDHGLTIGVVRPLLKKVGEDLSKLIGPIQERQKNVRPISGNFPVDKQVALSKRVVGDCGFSFESGRLDPAAHPFEAALGPEDVRLTTRYQTDTFLPSLYATLHEAGHGMYEYGLPKTERGRPLGTAVSFGFHESQSRFWENMIGRSRAFARYLHRVLGDFFPAEQKAMTPESLFLQVNLVSPSLIRVEADEVTYPLHIVIRLLLEEQIVSGELKVKDLPQAWHDSYKKYLGIVAPDDRDGVLQDVHWYCGYVGYFPTYALGTMYAAQFAEVIRRDIVDLDSQVDRGEFGAILGWLRKNVHSEGQRYSSLELVKKLTGNELSAEPYLNYLKAKLLN